MDKKLAYINQREINSALQAIEQSAKYHFQKLVDRYNSISILPHLETNDFYDLMKTPKSFLVLKLTKGQTLNIGELQLSTEKVYDLLDRPAEVDELINDIEVLNTDYTFQKNHKENIDFFDLKDGQLVIKKSKVNEVTESYSRYIESENQFKALELASELLPKINELFSLCDASRFKIFDNYGNGYRAPLERLFKGSGDTTARKYEIDLESIVDAF
ncbi:hypothetical protein [Epilithonimonas vandammei]|uniref:hypothetical protein n=1 Tax=Epilithonimonas vandammei TaxID=2487072 RepID=UPI0028AE2A02|nr:hypothetical protein [Epilithonimonas vandammei]